MDALRTLDLAKLSKKRKQAQSDTEKPSESDEKPSESDEKQSKSDEKPSKKQKRECDTLQSGENSPESFTDDLFSVSDHEIEVDETDTVGKCTTCGVRLKIWRREQDAPALSDLRTPTGIRSANGCVWVPSIDDLYLIPQKSWGLPLRDSTEPGIKLCDVKGLRLPGHDKKCFEVWSKSMVENFRDKGSDTIKRRLQPGTHEEARPEIRKPFPLLQLPTADGGSESHHNTEARIPKLEESIPTHMLPLFLAVVDPEGLALLCGERNSFTRKLTTTIYRRELPMPPTIVGSVVNIDGDPEPYMLDGYHAFVDSLKCPLTLLFDNLCGTGNHADAYRAPITLPKRVGVNSRSPDGRVSLVLKIAHPDKVARQMLRREAEGLQYLSTEHPHLQHEWTGLNVLPGRMLPATINAVVPKHYGFYVPHEEGSKASPISLLEDCGEPVHVKRLRRCIRHDALAMFSHLHTAGVVQRSVATRNILVQPGPLCSPPSERSMESPSLRVIDYGRIECPDRSSASYSNEYKLAMRALKLG